MQEEKKNVHQKFIDMIGLQKKRKKKVKKSTERIFSFFKYLMRISILTIALELLTMNKVVKCLSLFFAVILQNCNDYIAIFQYCNIAKKILQFN